MIWWKVQQDEPYELAPDWRWVTCPVCDRDLFCDDCEPVRQERTFWWAVRQVSNRWQPFYYGGTDEYCNRTLGIRVPFGVLFFRLDREIRHRRCALDAAGNCEHTRGDS